MIMKQQASSDWEKQANVSQQFQKNGRLCSGLGNGGKARTDPWTQTQPPAQCHQQVGSGTRAFSLGGDSGNGSCGTGGTGVFLPRGIWYSSEPRKKPGNLSFVCYIYLFVLRCQNKTPKIQIVLTNIHVCHLAIFRLFGSLYIASSCLSSWNINYPTSIIPFRFGFCVCLLLGLI
jgi:hypothetical protein